MISNELPGPEVVVLITLFVLGCYALGRRLLGKWRNQ